MNSPFALPIAISLQSKLSGGLQNPIATPLPSLGPTLASIASSAVAGTLIAAITGLAAGETIDTVTPNDGRLALDGTRKNLLVGLSALSVGTIAVTLKSSAGRTLAMALTFTASPVVLDAPITSANVAKTYAAWSPHRVNDTYSGPTIRLKRLSDNAEMDFAPGPTGELKPEQVDAWSPAGNEDVLAVYSTIPGVPNLTARGTVAFRRSGIAQRFGTSLDPVTGQLTRLTNESGLGLDLAGIGDLVTLTPITAAVSAKGMKAFQLVSLHNRKIASNDTTDPISGGNNTRENLLNYGASSTAQFLNYMGGGTFLDVGRVQAGNQQTQLTGRGVSRYVARSQMVTMEVIDLTAYKQIEHGKRVKNGAYVSATATAIAAGDLDNKYVGVGCALSGAGVFGTTSRMNGIWGGLILMEATTSAIEDFLVQAKMSAIGQAHMVISKAELNAMTDDGVNYASADTATGRVTGRNGKFTLQLNTSGSTWAYAYTHPDLGVMGLRSPDLSTLNSYQAGDNYFWDAINGGAITFGFTETNAQSTNLAWQFAMAAGDPQKDNRGDWSLALGNHHSTPNLVTKPAASRDPQGLVTGNRMYADGTQFGSDNFDSAKAQEDGKYAYNTPHRLLDPTAVDKAGYVYTLATWANQDPNVPKKLRDPVFPATPGNVTYPFKVDHLCLQISTWVPHSAFDRSAPYETRKPHLSTASNRSYVSGGGICPLGHVDGSIAIDDTAPVRDADPGHRIQTQFFQYPWQGVRAGLDVVDFGKRSRMPWTFIEAQKLQVNNYKRYAA